MHPKQLKLFRAWARAMEEGAIVGSPDYGKRAQGMGKRGTPKRRRRKQRLRRKRRQRHNNGE